MFLRRFSVGGYKNIRAPVVLDPLGPINVLHGANNVGKSNLLQAMALFFRCVNPLVDALPIRKSHVDLNKETSDLAPDVRSLFNLERPTPIVLSGVLDVSPDELATAGVEEAAASTIDVEVAIEWDATRAKALAEVTRLRLEDGTDLAHSDKEAKGALRLAALVARNLAVQSGPDERFSILGVHRGLEEVDSAPLVGEMYDCRDSDDRGRRDRWRVFVRAMEEFRDVTGEGSFEVTLRRTEKQARLVFDTDNVRIPFRLLGTGVQQAAAVLGNLLMRNASIVAIEEPELNLRWALQERLREGLSRVVKPGENGAVNQLFLSSHSPAFEAGDTFFLMEPGSSGPTVSRRPATELPLLLGGGVAPHLGLPDAAPYAYVTSQGIVRLPDEVVARVHVRGGGGVVFPNADPHGVRIVSNDDMLRELGMSAEGEADADG